MEYLRTYSIDSAQAVRACGYSGPSDRTYVFDIWGQLWKQQGRGGFPDRPDVFGDDPWIRSYAGPVATGGMRAGEVQF